MLHKHALTCLALGLAALASGCATEQESPTEAAQAACQERHVAPGPEMDACIVETAEAIRRAREYQAPRPVQTPP